MLDGNFVQKANKFNFNVTLPALLFKDLSNINFKEQFHLDFVLFCMISTSVCFWLIWGGAKVFLKDKRMRSAFVQGSFRSSAAVLGIAFIQNLCGDSGMGPMMINKTVGSLSSMATPLALIAIGAGFELGDAWKKVKPALAATMVKLVVQTAVFMPVIMKRYQTIFY